MRPYQPLGLCSGQEAKDNFPRLQQPGALRWRARVTYVLKGQPKNTKVLRHSDESKYRTAAERYLRRLHSIKKQQRRILSQLFPHPPSFQSCHRQRGPAGSSRVRPFVAGAAGEAAPGALRWMRAGLNIKPSASGALAPGRDSRSHRPEPRTAGRSRR